MRRCSSEILLELAVCVSVPDIEEVELEHEDVDGIELALDG